MSTDTIYTIIAILIAIGLLAAFIRFVQQRRGK